MGMWTVFIPHMLWYVSSLYSDGVARVFTASQERKASPDQIAVSSVVKSVCVRWLKKQVQSCLLVHFHHHALSLFDKVSSYFTP